MATEKIITLDNLTTYNEKLNEKLAAKYYNKTEVDGKLSSIPKFKIEVLTDGKFPNVDEGASISESTIYLMPNSVENPTYYTEYLYNNGQFEAIGTTKAELDQYLEKEKIVTYSNEDNTIIRNVGISYELEEDGSQNGEVVLNIKAFGETSLTSTHSTINIDSQTESGTAEMHLSTISGGTAAYSSIDLNDDGSVEIASSGMPGLGEAKMSLGPQNVSFEVPETGQFLAKMASNNYPIVLQGYNDGQYAKESQIVQKQLSGTTQEYAEVKTTINPYIVTEGLGSANIDIKAESLTSLDNPSANINIVAMTENAGSPTVTIKTEQEGYTGGQLSLTQSHANLHHGYEVNIDTSDGGTISLGGGSGYAHPEIKLINGSGEGDIGQITIDASEAYDGDIQIKTQTASIHMVSDWLIKDSDPVEQISIKAGQFYSTGDSPDGTVLIEAYGKDKYSSESYQYSANSSIELNGGEVVIFTHSDAHGTGSILTLEGSENGICRLTSYSEDSSDGFYVGNAKCYTTADCATEEEITALFN